MAIKIDWASFRKKRTPLKNGFPVGMVIFTGVQGGGKSLSQSRYMYQLQQKYKARVYSATDYKYADEVIEETDIASKILTKREDVPTIFALDEIQILLDKDNADADRRRQVRKAIMQQRKRNTTIVATAQVLHDLDTMYRRQLAYVVTCMKFGNLQIEFWTDGSSIVFDDEARKYKGKVIDIKIWKRHNEMFALYDTFEIVGSTEPKSRKLQQSTSTQSG